MFFSPKKTKQLNHETVIQRLSEHKHADDMILLKDLMEHILVVGSTGSGKTSTVGYYLCRGIMQAKEKIGMVVFQYKDDTQQWLDWAAKFGRAEDVIVIDDHDTNVFNILEGYQNQDANSAVETLAVLSELSVKSGGEKQSEPYWEIMMRQRLHRLVLLNQLSGEPLNPLTLFKIHSSAPQLPEQLHDTDFHTASFCWQMLAKAQARMGAHHPKFQLVEEYFVRVMPYMADKTQSSILSIAGGVLEPFVNSDLLQNLFCGSTNLSLDVLLSGKIVILNLPIQKHHYAGRVAQMLFKHVLQKRIEGRDLVQMPHPVIFFLDEYQHLISKHDTLFMSTARSSRAGMLMMTQNISSLYAQVGGSGSIAEQNVNSLLALANHKIFLAQNNHVTNEFAAKTIGMGLHQLTSSSTDMQRMAGNAGVSESYHYQVMPTEFTMLKRGGVAHNHLVEAIITATGKRFSNGRNYLHLTLKQPWV